MTLALHRLSRSGWPLLLLLAVGGYGFFGLQLGDASRIITALWNLGHIVFFFLLGIVMLRLFPGLYRVKFWLLLWGASLATLALGALIEFLQTYVGRSMSLQDILLNALGMLLAISLFAPQRRQLARPVAGLLLGSVLVLLAFAAWPVYRTVVDVYYVHRLFPVLSDFTTPYELMRWQGRHVELNLQQDKHAASMQARFKPARYATLLFEGFGPDWRGYTSLVIELTNPVPRNIGVTIRIHDQEHDLHHNAHADRFNRYYELTGGRQVIRIDLADVRGAPTTRNMNMAHIRNISMYMYDTRVNHDLVVHAVYLE